MKQKLKVLVSAYACEPGKGSEPGIGWNWMNQIAKRHEVWVLTRANNREPIERELKQNPMPNAHFIYLDLPYWMRFWKRGRRGIHLYYYLWQIAAFVRARRLYRKIPFDLAHNVTFMCDWMPSFLSLLPIPFIWGPIGSQQPPKPLRQEIVRRSLFQEDIKLIVRVLTQYLNPVFRASLKRAVRIVALDTSTALRLPQRYQAKVIIIPATGISMRELPQTNIQKTHLFNVLMVGQFHHCKGFSIAIKAFARFVQQYPDARLILIGRGAEYARLQRLVSENGISDKVEFHDWMPRIEVLKFMQAADVFLFPSYEGGGMVVIEAMAAGKPVVCLDAGGPGEAVTDECGIKVKVQHIDQIIQDLSDALYKLAKEPLLRRNMGEVAKQRIQEVYDWDRKGEQIERLYELVMSDEKQR